MAPSPPTAIMARIKVPHASPPIHQGVFRPPSSRVVITVRSTPGPGEATTVILRMMKSVSVWDKIQDLQCIQLEENNIRHKIPEQRDDTPGGRGA